MKKGLILITVILFALILILRYVEEKSGRTEKSGAEIQVEKGAQGVFLPKTKETTDMGDEREENYDSGLVSYDDPITLSEGEGFEKACDKGSIKDIYIAHGKIWGYTVASSRGFNESESEAIYSRLAQYTACRAAAQRSIDYCNKLPAGLKKVGEAHSVPMRASAYYECVETVNRVIFSDFMAGNAKEKSSCDLILAGQAFEGKPMSDDIFCKAAGKGLVNMCMSFKDQGVKGDEATLKMCFTHFPRTLSDCSSKNCKRRYKLYTAIKNKKYKECPREYKDICRAYLSKSTKPCHKLAEDLSETYCDFLKRVNKVTGNAPGMSDEDIKHHAAQLEAEAIAERKLKEQERLQAERDRKENEQITKEINARVKKLLGKE
ncbi:MAG: hypothetical protein KAR84_00135 [Elusimicrobiales bacterium]|nr:hypothetical protein [Elusimicrobiales bacterium]MCK5358182.1 hypothetical protein [Elusimicrobiales bacterium]